MHVRGVDREGVCVCVCVYVCCLRERKSVCVCVCVCVYLQSMHVRGVTGERGREGGSEWKRERVLVCVCVCVGNLETVFTLKANANQAETLPVRLLLIVIQFMFIF